MTIPTLWRHFKNAVRYEWFDVLCDRLYSTEHCDDLPLTDIHQDIARRITFEWGFAVCLGISMIVWIFAILLRFNTNIPLLVVTALAFLALDLLGGAFFGAIYLFVKLILIEKRSKDAEDQ